MSFSLRTRRLPAADLMTRLVTFRVSHHGFRVKLPPGDRMDISFVVARKRILQAVECYRLELESSQIHRTLDLAKRISVVNRSLSHRGQRRPNLLLTFMLIVFQGKERPCSPSGTPWNLHSHLAMDSWKPLPQGARFVTSRLKNLEEPCWKTAPLRACSEAAHTAR